MNYKSLISATLLSCSLGLAAATEVPKGTDVTLTFQQNLSSKTAKPGDRVHLQVARDVMVGNATVLKAGTPVTGIIERVSKKGVFGKNASIRLTINPVNGVPLQPREKGHDVKGSRTDHAAEASGAGLILLGPVGLVGGLFIQGKTVNIHPGDKLETEVSRTVDVH